MIGRSVIHDTFTLERTYLATPSRVFAAFASIEARNGWGDIGDMEEAEGDAAIGEFDFRVGGRDRWGFKRHGTTYRVDFRYYDIVQDQRIIYSYEMYANDVRISVSVTTIEFAKSGDGTALAWTEQGAYLDGFDGDEAPALRREGTEMMVDNLTGYLNARAQL
jgi:uncharacterized protein YndB with AHSA1/START domain